LTNNSRRSFLSLLAALPLAPSGLFSRLFTRTKESEDKVASRWYGDRLDLVYTLDHDKLFDPYTDEVKRLPRLCYTATPMQNFELTCKYEQLGPNVGWLKADGVSLESEFFRKITWRPQQVFLRGAGQHTGGLVCFNYAYYQATAQLCFGHLEPREPGQLAGIRNRGWEFDVVRRPVFKVTEFKLINELPQLGPPCTGKSTSLAAGSMGLAYAHQT
jgi:hypothetical protein